MAIHKLPDILVAQIAAGEVIESPTGALKELIENSIDAGSTKIEVIIKGAGLESLQVRDNGNGISREDLPLAIESFATSKIDSADDLFQITTMGFRGEALSSIRSVSHMTIESRRRLSGGPGESGKEEFAEKAWKIEAAGDEITGPVPCAHPSGTRILVEDLFFNVPIRKKFIKNEKSIIKEITELVSGYGLAYPERSFSLVSENRSVLQLPAAASLVERIEQIYGRSFREKMSPLFREDEGLEIEGFISAFHSYHGRSNLIKIFINKRPVKYSPLVSILKRTYGELLPPGKFPAAFLFLEVDPEEIDVNVHPQKREIRFKNDDRISRFIARSVAGAIEEPGGISATRLIKPKAPGQSSKIVAKTPPANERLDFGMDLEVRHEGREARPITWNEQELHVAEPAPNYETAQEVSEAQSGAPPVAEQEESLPDKPEIVHARLFDTFILATSPAGIYLIDQHTAHERIQYEKFLIRLEGSKDLVAPLLTPVTVALSPAEAEFARASVEYMRSFGFEFEDLGPAGFLISGAPFYLKTRECEEAFHKALAFLDKNPDAQPPRLFDHMAKSLACRSAIKKGDRVSLQDLSELIEELYRCKNPGRCPHGRPTIVKLGKKEIFHMFKRFNVE